MGLTHAALQKNVISGAEPVVSAEGEGSVSLSSQTIQSNYAFFVAVEQLRKLSGASTHIPTPETPWDLGAKKTVPVFSPGSNYANQHAVSIKYAAFNR